MEEFIHCSDKILNKNVSTLHHNYFFSSDKQRLTFSWIILIQLQDIKNNGFFSFSSIVEEKIDLEENFAINSFLFEVLKKYYVFSSNFTTLVKC